MDRQYNLANGTLEVGRAGLWEERPVQSSRLSVSMLPVATISRYNHTNVCVCNCLVCVV